MKFNIRNAFLVISIVVSALACSTLPIQDLPISDDVKKTVAIESGCAIAISSGCFGTQPEIVVSETHQQAIAQLVNLTGAIVDLQTCKDSVNRIVTEKTLKIDIAALTSEKMNCKTFVDALLGASK
jgi:hypothetical protein